MSELTDLLNGSSDLGDQENAALQQKLLAQKLREGLRAPREFKTPGAALGGLVSNIIGGVSAGRYDEQANQGLAAARAKRAQILGSLPTTTDPTQARALSRSLNATMDPSLGVVGKGLESEAVAREKDDMMHAKLINALVSTGMKGDTALAVADLHYNRPTYHNTPGDLNHSGGVFDPRTATLTPTGTAKPPGATGAGANETPLDEPALDQAARAALKDPTVLSRFNPRGNNRVKIFNRMAQIEPDHPYAESWATYKGQVAANTALEKQTALLRPFEQMLGANSKIVLDAMDKIPDSDIGFVNALTRTAASQFGSEDMAKFHAALNTFSTEAARILNNPNLTGQLTDSARKDLQAIHSGNYSKKQLQAVIKITQAEADNRLSALENEGILMKKRAGARTPSDKPRALPNATGATSDEDLINKYLGK